MGAKEDALTFVESWRTAGGPRSFIQMNRETVATQLKDRVNDPTLIQQGTAGLCAPAGFSYETALHQPYIYALAVTDLYGSGKARIGKMDIKPCSDLRKAPCPANVPQADWILLASIRDQLNWFFDYVTDEYDDGKHNSLTSAMWGGGTAASETESLFKKAGYTDVKSEKAKGEAKQKALFEAAVKLFDADYQVLLRINADILYGKAVSDSAESNHVVALRASFSPPTAGATKVQVPIFTWGQSTFIPQKATMEYQQITKGIFGYIAGKL